VNAHDAVVDAALVVGAINFLVGAYGSVRWLMHAPSRAFWFALRIAQASAVIFALLFGGVYISGHKPSQPLFYLYGLLPLVIAFVAEQLRLVSADQILENRGLENAHAVGELPETEQALIVHAILRREMGIMALAALVVSFLALRAAGTW
jgi:hypothetical protein